MAVAPPLCKSTLLGAMHQKKADKAQMVVYLPTNYGNM